MPRKRWFFQVLRDILAQGSGTKTDFMYAGKINSQQLDRYLGFLLDNGLMEVGSPKGYAGTYRLTSEGEHALVKLQEIIQFVKADEG